MRKIAILAGFAAYLCTMAGYGAERFENSYISFLLPTRWTCNQEDGNFVCLPGRVKDEPVAAIMVLTAKFANATDTLANYQQHLEREPPATGRGQIAERARITTIGETLWVQATLDGSEIPSYRTRYLATVSNDVAILVTFSAHRTVFDDYMGAAMQALQTLETRTPLR